MAGGDGGVVEEAEAHRLVALGMMARRAHGAEGVGRASAHDLVDGVDGRPDAVKRRSECPRRHDGVGIDLDHALLGRGFHDRLRIGGGMAERDLGERAFRGLDALQECESLILKRLLDGADAVGAFGMARRRDMAEAGRMADQQRRHAQVSDGREAFQTG
jgi:hypothetical protein